MALHREVVTKEDGTKHLILGFVPGNFERLIAGDTTIFEAGGITVTLVFGRSNMLAGDAGRAAKEAIGG
jgi:hypothetical protein